MSRLLVALGLGAVLWGVADPGRAQPLPCGQGPLIAFAHETLAIGTAPVSLTQATYAPPTGPNAGGVAIAALVTVRTRPISVLDDGSAPTATEGTVFSENSVFWLCRHSIGAAQMIRQGTADATIRVIYYRTP